MCKIKQASYISFFLFCITLAGLAYLIYPNVESIPDTYRQVFAFAKKENTSSSTQQVRYGVEKTHLNGGTTPRGTVNVVCDKSTLELYPKKGLGQSVEEMETITATWEPKGERQLSYRLQAQQALFYPKSSQIVMQKVSAEPKARPSVPNSLEVIDAGSAEYDGTTLRLMDNVKARFETVEIMAGQAQIFPKKMEQKTEISKIKLEDNVFINSLVDVSPFSIKAPHLEWDLETNAITSNAAPDQICMEDPTSLIYGDNLTAYLYKDNQTLTPKSIHLAGNVKIQKYTASGSQYAIADALDYNPVKHEWELSAIAPHRVLYYDKQNSITISAPKILVKQNTDKAKPHVKALGDVRFVFAEQELSELMNRFQSSALKKP
ncbi:MAG: hypothetical protein WC222_08430 [Parachlamydiales bacterium]|jgi:lipopolysaccharide export system protein LptA